MARWSKGTTDHDGDGHMGGSRPADRSDKGRTGDPSRSDLAPDPEKEDNTMAKAPAKSTKTPSPAPAPSQPWAKPAADAKTDTAADTPADETAAGGNGGGENTEATGEGSVPATNEITSTADVPTTDAAEIPGEDSDDVDVDNTHEQAERLAENDVAQVPEGTEVPSFVRDQITPSGIDIALEADRSERPPLERSAYPSLGERLYQMLGKASPELAEEFENRMVELAETVIEDLRKNAQDEITAGLMIDGTQHYGPRVQSGAARGDGVSGPTNAQMNRRARRAAERVAQASVAGKTGK